MPNPNTKHNAPKSSPITRATTKPKPSFRKRSSSAPTWDEIPQSIVHALVCACATCNAPPTFGYTRDGTALTVSIYFEGERYVDYLADSDEVLAYFDWLLDELLPLDDSDRLRFRQARL